MTALPHTQTSPCPVLPAQRTLPVLVVDDEEQVARAVKRTLEGRYRVDTASNVHEALHKLFKKEYYAVVTDFQMPGHDGIWLLALVRDLFPWVRRVLHSGSDPADLAVHVDSGLVQRFVGKPAIGDLVDSLSENQSRH